MDERNMTTADLDEPLKPGTVVRIRNSGYGRCRIAEYRGPLGPKGARVYRVRVRKKPHSAYTEVLESQLEVIPARTESPAEGTDDKTDDKGMIRERPEGD
jgi:hypothetical protein